MTSKTKTKKPPVDEVDDDNGLGECSIVPGNSRA